MTLFDAKCGLGDFSRPVIYKEPEELLKVMEQYSIEKALVYNSTARELCPVEGNSLLIKQIKGYPSLLPSWTILPKESHDVPDFEEYIKQGIEFGVSALRIYPNTHKIPLEHYIASGTFKLPEERKIPVIIEPCIGLVSALDAGDWQGIRMLCEKHPKLPVVFTEYRTRFQIRIVSYFLKYYSNFYYDVCSCWNYKIIEKLAEITKGDNLVASTNLPIAEPGQTVGMLLLADIKDDIREKISFLNMEKLVSGIIK